MTGCDDRRLLADGARQLGLALDDGQLDALLRYLALLLKWNRVYNLTAIRDADDGLTHHLLDSLAAVPALAAAARAGNKKVLDVGSGGGLPGIVLAIACPDLAVTLVDTVQKKTAFQLQAKAELGLANLEPIAARVEKLAPPAGGYGLITSRAFAELRDFVDWSAHLLAPDGCFIAMKGVMPDGEVAAMPPGWRVADVRPLQVPGLAAQRHLLTIVRA